MKKILVILAAAALASVGTANAQGFFNFSNFATGAGVNAPDHETDGTTALGNTYKADCFWAPAGVAATDNHNSAFQSVTAGAGVSYSGSGYFLGGTQTINGQSGTVSLEVRAWKASDGATYAAAAAVAGTHTGVSQVIQVTLATGSNPPAQMVGLASFNLTVPEPSTVAMAVMGLGGLLIRRRK